MLRIRSIDTMREEMTEEERQDRREALEAAIWKSGYRGSPEELDTILDAAAQWLEAIVESRCAALSREIASVQVAEIADLQRQVDELSRHTRELHLERAAVDDDDDPPEVPEAAYKDFTDQLDRIESDPYGDALLAALEEVAEEQHDPEAEALRWRDADTLGALAAEMEQVPEGVTLTGSADPEHRICRTCKERKVLTEFKVDKSMVGGRRSDCRRCVGKRDRDRAARKAQESAAASAPGC